MLRNLVVTETMPNFAPQNKNKHIIPHRRALCTTIVPDKMNGRKIIHFIRHFLYQRTNQSENQILKDMEIVSSKKTKLAKPGFVFIQTVVMKTLYSVPHNFMYNHLNI